MFFSLYVLVFYRFQINEIYVRMCGNFLPYIMKISSVSNKIFFRIYFSNTSVNFYRKIKS